MWLYIIRVGIAISVLLNVLLGGYSNQTLSARNYDWKRRGLPNAVWLIDKLFFLETNHCMTSWVYWITMKVEKDKWANQKAENQADTFLQA